MACLNPGIWIGQQIGFLNVATAGVDDERQNVSFYGDMAAFTCCQLRLVGAGRLLGHGWSRRLWRIIRFPRLPDHEGNKQQSDKK